MKKATCFRMSWVFRVCVFHPVVFDTFCFLFLWLYNVTVEIAAGGRTLTAGRWWTDILQLCLLGQIASSPSSLLFPSSACLFTHTGSEREAVCWLSGTKSIQIFQPQGLKISDTAGCSLILTEAFQRSQTWLLMADSDGQWKVKTISSLDQEVKPLLLRNCEEKVLI